MKIMWSAEIQRYVFFVNVVNVDLHFHISHNLYSNNYNNSKTFDIPEVCTVVWRFGGRKTQSFTLPPSGGGLILPEGLSSSSLKKIRLNLKFFTLLSYSCYTTFISVDHVWLFTLSGLLRLGKEQSSLRSGVWEPSAEIPYWGRDTTQIWVVMRRPYGISALVSQMSFRWETSGSVANCRLFSQAKVKGEKLSPTQSVLMARPYRV